MDSHWNTFKFGQLRRIIQEAPNLLWINLESGRETQTKKAEWKLFLKEAAEHPTLKGIDFASFSFHSQDFYIYDNLLQVMEDYPMFKLSIHM